MNTRNDKIKTLTIASTIATLLGLTLLILGIILNGHIYYAFAFPLIFLSIVNFVYYIKKKKEDLFYSIILGSVAIILVATLIFYATTI